MSASIRRTDILALADLRDDGRKPHDIRQVRIQMGPLSNSVGGSALIEMGLTVALATVRGPIECLRRSDELPDKAILQVTVKTAPFSPAMDRRTANPNNDRRLIESSNMIRQALEASALLHLYPRARIEINVMILADDGGRLCAAINAASLALVDAGIPMKDFVCACSAGYATALDMEKTLVDLNYREESSMAGQPAVQLTAAILPQRNTLVLSQCEARLPSFDAMERVLETAMDGCQAVFQTMQAAVRERTLSQYSLRSNSANVKLTYP
jgi:exosome complex component RRP41